MPKLVLDDTPVSNKPRLVLDSDEQDEHTFLKQTIESQRLEKEVAVQEQAVQAQQAQKQQEDFANNPANWSLSETKQRIKDNPPQSVQQEAFNETLLEAKKAEVEKAKIQVRRQMGIPEVEAETKRASIEAQSMPKETIEAGRKVVQTLPQAFTPEAGKEYLRSIPAGLTGAGEMIGSSTEWLGEAVSAMAKDPGVQKKVGDFIARIGDDAQQFWGNEQKRIAAERGSMFRGSFTENPSAARAAAMAIESIPLLASAFAISAGVTTATGNPAIGAVAGAGSLGLLEGSQTYREARESGKSVGYSSALGGLSAVGNTVLESLPLFTFLKGGRITKQVIKGMAQEGLEEALQSLFSNLIAKFGYDNTRNLTNGIVEGMVAGALSGGVLGGFTSGGVSKLSALKTEALKKGISQEQIDTLQNAVAAQIATNSGKIQSGLEKISQPSTITKDMVDKANVGEITPEAEAIAKKMVAEAGGVPAAKGVFITKGSPEFNEPAILYFNDPIYGGTFAIPLKDATVEAIREKITKKTQEFIEGGNKTIPQEQAWNIAQGNITPTAKKAVESTIEAGGGKVMKGGSIQKGAGDVPPKAIFSAPGGNIDDISIPIDQLTPQNVTAKMEEALRRYITTGGGEPLPGRDKLLTKEGKELLVHWSYNGIPFTDKIENISPEYIKNKIATKAKEMEGARTPEQMKADVLGQVKGDKPQPMPASKVKEIVKKWEAEHPDQPEEGTTFSMGGAKITPPKQTAIEQPAPQEPVKFSPLKSKLEAFYQNAVNPLSPIARLEKQAKEAGANIPEGESPEKRSREYLGMAGKINSVLEDSTFSIKQDGNYEITGEGLSPILIDYENGLREIEPHLGNQIKDLGDYLEAQRILLDLQRPVREGGDIIATPKQTAKAKEDLTTLQAKYGDTLQHFEKIAQRLYAFKNRVLHLLVDSGRISEDTYQKIIKANPHHVSFTREIEGVEEGGAVPTKKGLFSKVPNPIKRIKGGSDLKIQEVLGSIVRDTAKIIDAAERATVANDVISLKEFLPQEFKKITPPIIPVATVQHKAGIDVGLTNKLKRVLSDLKVDYQRKLRIGGRGRLGFYQYPNTIRTKFATPEGVIAHELGHLIDFKYGLQKQIMKFSQEQTGRNKAETRRMYTTINKELRALADMRKVSPSYGRSSPEKMAALMDAYITKPNLIDEVAPNAGAMLQNILASHEELRPLLDARPTMQAGFETEMETIFRQSPFAPTGNVITGYENGKPTYYEVSPSVYKAMSGLSKTGSNIIVKILSHPASWLRTGATITPEFITRNWLGRDQITAAMQTNFGFVPLKDSTAAIADILGKSDVYYDWLRSGAAQSGFVELSRKNLAKNVKQLMRPKTYNALRHANPILAMSDLSMLLEQATRVGVFKAARRSGMSAVEAGFQSREATTDFGLKGLSIAEYGRLVPFLTANIAGLDKTVRTMAAHPGRTFLKGLAWYTIPTMLLYLLNRENESYKQMPRWQKDIFWHIPLGKERGFLFPKGFTYGTIFSSIPERFMEYLDTKDKSAFDGFLKTVLDSASPVQGDPTTNILPQAIKPLLENKLNYSFFRERKIVPREKEYLRPEYQYTDYTSTTSKEVGKILNTSPAKLDNLVAGYAGGTGRYALQGTDKLINWAKGEKEKRPTDLGDMPLIKGWVTRPYYQNPESVNKFYNSLKTIEQDYLSVRYAYKQGDMSAVKKIIKKNPDIRFYPAMNKARKALSNIQDAIDKVNNSDISAEKKKSATEKLYKLRLSIADRVNKVIKSR